MKQITNKASRASRSLGLLLVFCLILVPTFLHAGELDETEVGSAVQTWARHVTADARPDAVIERMEPHQVKGETVAYIAHLVGGGFCLCGSDDLVLPVYLYSPRGTYDPQNPNYQYILWEIETRVKCLREGLEKGDPTVLGYQDFLAKRASFWQDLMSGRTPPRMEEKGEPVMMELDLTSQWHQRTPYNDQCPDLTPDADEHTVVGCVATAMCQIMYYWRWPYTGVGIDTTIYNYLWRSNWDEEPLVSDPNIQPDWAGGGRLEWTSAEGGKLRMNGYWDGSLYKGAKKINEDADYLDALENLWNRLYHVASYCIANFGATTYDWSIIGDTHTDPPDAGDVEVAKLCYHAGVAVIMGYGVWGSGASTWNVDSAFEDHFRYDYDGICGTRDIDTMTEEIQWLRPLYFSGDRHDTLGGGGHAWVVLGYNKWTDPARQFKMNLGWGGACDEWYSCDSIPCAPFYLNQLNVTRIAPKDMVGFVGGLDPGDGSPGDPYQDVEEAIDEAPDNATLIFKAGSDNTFSTATLLIDRPLTLKGKDVTIRKE